MTTQAKVTNGTGWTSLLDGQLVQTGDTLELARGRVVRFIKKQPLLCLLGALAAGYVVGRLVRT
jgi:hypothetical protein